MLTHDYHDFNRTTIVSIGRHYVLFPFTAFLDNEYVGQDGLLWLGEDGRLGLGQDGLLGLVQDGPLYFALCLSVTMFFLVLFKYCCDNKEF